MSGCAYSTVTATPDSAKHAVTVRFPPRSFHSHHLLVLPRLLGGRIEQCCELLASGGAGLGGLEEIEEGRERGTGGRDSEDAIYIIIIILFYFESNSFSELTFFSGSLFFHLWEKE